MIKNNRTLLIGLAFFASGILLSHTYRPYIYSNSLYDFHLADTIGNLVCVPASVFIFYSLSWIHYSFSNLIIKSTIAFIIYELVSLTGVHGVFDVFDLVAIIISSGSLYLCYRILTNSTCEQTKF